MKGVKQNDHMTQQLHSCCCYCCLVTQSCPILLQPPWDFLGKITTAGCHFFLQGTFWPRNRTCISRFPTLQADSLLLNHLPKRMETSVHIKHFHTNILDRKKVKIVQISINGWLDKHTVIYPHWSSIQPFKRMKYSYKYLHRWISKMWR